MNFLYIALTIAIGFLTEERNSINFKFLNSKQISIVSKSKDLIPKKDKKKKLKPSLARNTSSKGEKKPEDSFVRKEDLLPPDFYKPKRTKEELETNFNLHLKKINEICEIKEKKNRKAKLRERIKEFKNYLKSRLNEDPYMNSKMRYLFAGVSDFLEDINIYSLNSFRSSYKSFYGIREEDLKVEDYYHEWAKALDKSIDCS